jgi:NNP family nitrate/nitrite transporter-like MFS transporter
MNRRDSFLESGHLPTLIAALLYFDVSFMVWVLLGPLAPFLRQAFTMSATQQGLLVAIPLLGGSCFRPLLGLLGDRIGGRRAGLIGLSLTMAALVGAWQVAHTITGFYVVGFLFGVAGASFAVALPLASRWYPPKHQGLAMGIAGAGNSGTVFATLCAPRLAQAFGWRATFGFVLLPVTAVLAAFALMAKDSPSARTLPSARDYAAVLRDGDTYWFAFVYSLTFGGFVGFAAFLTTFFNEQYHVSRVAAGDFTTLVVISGSLLRPVGGWLSDRLGGYRLLLILLAAASACIAVVAQAPSLGIVVAVLFVAMGALGMANGAVFQLVPQRFGDRMGLVTGLVGAAGGLGGFFLPSLLGVVKDSTGSYRAGLLLCAAVFAAGTAAFLEAGARWTAHWEPRVAGRAGVFSYRGFLRSLFPRQVA